MLPMLLRGVTGHCQALGISQTALLEGAKGIMAAVLGAHHDGSGPGQSHCGGARSAG